MEGKTAGQSPTPAIELGREYLRALQAKDKQAIFAILADDFVLEVPFNVSGTNDYSDSWQGLEAADANYDTTFRIIEDLVYTDLEFTAGHDPNVAFAEGLGVMTMANGRPYRNRYVFRFEADDGKLKRIREYANPVTSAISFGLPLPESSDDGVADQFV
jgi:ketosteroid isomerase-like protein